MHKRLLLSLVVSMFAAVACANPSDPTGTVAATACTSDDDCAEGKQCVARRCVDLAENNGENNSNNDENNGTNNGDPDAGLDADDEGGGNNGDPDADGDADVPEVPQVGDPCDGASDCPSGYCIEVPGRSTRVCTDFCSTATDCPEEWTCAAVANSGADITFLCFPETRFLCAECEADSDCGGLSDRCLDYLDGRFCGRSCDVRACPDGYDCVDVREEGAAEEDFQCVKQSRYCSDCFDPDNDGYGVGEGCMGEDCDEEDPRRNPGEAEVCDHQDNDCDTSIDEDFDFNTDAEHCGACDVRCVLPGAVAACEERTCVVAECERDYFDYNAAQPGCEYFCQLTNNGVESCDSQDNDCDGTADEGFVTGSDPLNCRFCNDVCAFTNAAATCEDFQCVRGACNQFFHDVDDNPDDCEYACIPTNNGVERCDEVDNDCDGEIDEDFELESDELHCGRCGNACADVPNATEACRDGQCRIDACDDGRLNCNTSGVDGGYFDGCESSRFDVNTCLSCDNRCAFANGMAGCNASGCFLAGCLPNWWDIRNGAVDGCEYYCVPTNGGVEQCDSQDNDCDGLIDEDFDLTSNATHCGVCNNTCSFEHATALCDASACDIQRCDTNYDNCNTSAADGGLSDGCESYLPEDEANCGRCGRACGLAHADNICLGGECAILACRDTWRNCDNLTETGCEVNIHTSLSHCGGCNLGCNFAHASETCDFGRCTFTGCDTNWWDLNGDIAQANTDGCEYSCTRTGSADDPDPAATDSNCDGIDGLLNRSVFVSIVGNNSRDGRTPGQAVRTITRGLEIADTCNPKCDVLVSTGTYDESITLRSGVDIYGGYNPTSWARSITDNLVLLRATGSIGVTADSLTTATVLDGLTIEGRTYSTGGQSTYAVWAKDVASNRLTIQNAVIRAGNGGVGDAGGAGDAGATGSSGSNATNANGAGGGTVSCGADGGSGGGAWNCGSGGGGGGSAGGDTSSGGGGGSAGSNRCGGGCDDSAGNGGGATGGGVGAGGAAVGAPTDTDGSFTSSGFWSPATSSAGSRGSHGTGGGGGGAGGTDKDDWYCAFWSGTSVGGGGGGGGAGGCGGAPGGVGSPGGGSFGVVAFRSTIRVLDTTIRRGNGGTGGAGGVGGAGGRGQSGGGGHNPSDDEAGTGAGGASGGDGGGGAGGTGGCGGVSVGIASVSGSNVTATGVSYVTGSGGVGGDGGLGGREGGRTTSTRGATGNDGCTGYSGNTRSW